MEHRHGRRGTRMTVGRPCVEREQGAQDAKPDEKEREENVLNLCGNVGHGSYLVNVHRGGSAEEVYGQDADDEQGRTAHEHQGELHGCIFLGSGSPYADKQVHGDEGHLVKHEHGEHVGRDEETEHTRAEQGEPQEVLLVLRDGLPGGKGSGENDDGRE